MDQLLTELRTVLKKELELETAKKENDAIKADVLEKLYPLIKTDSFGTDFVTIKKGLSIKTKDKKEAVQFMKESFSLDKEMVQEYFLSGQPTPGVVVKECLTTRKKSEGLL